MVSQQSTVVCFVHDPCRIMVSLPCSQVYLFALTQLLLSVGSVKVSGIRFMLQTY